MVMNKLSKNFTLPEFQNLINKIYSLPDDRLFSLWDLVSNQERFTMRALKGIRKDDTKKLTLNILVSFSWLMAIGNRLHIDVEKVIWERFSGTCSYCRKAPCICRKNKNIKRVKSNKSKSFSKPKTFEDFQNMFRMIYPPDKRTLPEVGVHLAEEMGELSEAIHIFLGEHRAKEFKDIEDEIADYVSCIFGVANSSNINVSKELFIMYKNNCHVCHKAPCVCNFSSVAKYKS